MPPRRPTPPATLTAPDWRVAVAAGRLCTRGHIQHGAAVEEALGAELEADGVHGHDRPVLGTREVGQPEGVPHDKVLAVEVAVGLTHSGRPAPPACWFTKSPVG